jgi:hypothetical protein
VAAVPTASQTKKEPKRIKKFFIEIKCNKIATIIGIDFQD